MASFERFFPVYRRLFFRSNLQTRVYVFRGNQPSPSRCHASNDLTRRVPLLLSLLLYDCSLELIGTQVYEPDIRALLGTASNFCEVAVLKLRTCVVYLCK